MRRLEFIRFEASTETGFAPGRYGLLLAAIDLEKHIRRDHPLLPELQCHLQWFTENLSRPPGTYEGVETWFKPSAIDHIEMGRSLAALLAQVNLPMRERRSPNPGEILWQDDIQVVVRPAAP